MLPTPRALSSLMGTLTVPPGATLRLSASRVTSVTEETVVGGGEDVGGGVGVGVAITGVGEGVGLGVAVGGIVGIGGDGVGVGVLSSAVTTTTLLRVTSVYPSSSR